MKEAVQTNLVLPHPAAKRDSPSSTFPLGLLHLAGGDLIIGIFCPKERFDAAVVWLEATVDQNILEICKQDGGRSVNSVCRYVESKMSNWMH